MKPYSSVCGGLLSSGQNFRPVQTQRIYRRQTKDGRNGRICLRKDRKHCGKRRKCWLLAFTPFPTMFSKLFISKALKTGDYLIKG